MDNRHYSGTFLPEVAVHQKWTAAETVAQLIRKARYTGKITPALLKSLKLERYQTKKWKMAYLQYVTFFNSYYLKN